MKSIFALFGCILSFCFHVQASAGVEIYNVRNKSVGGVEELVSSLRPGTILVLGEIHDHPGHHLSHKMILEEMIAQGVSFDVGMEFFYYPDQPLVEDYIFENISESQFLKDIGWGRSPFDWYRPKVLLPLETEGMTFAINAPRALTRAVARGGLDSLTPELEELMPPNFVVGNDDYFERFKLAVGGDHFPPDLLDNYFAAQSIWDETMAWQSLGNFQKSKQDVFVIIVGDFHVSYGGGLPDRLLARGAEHVVTVSHMDSTEMSEREKSSAMDPHPDWGLRSDWISFAPRSGQGKTQTSSHDLQLKLRNM